MFNIDDSHFWTCTALRTTYKGGYTGTLLQRSISSYYRDIKILMSNQAQCIILANPDIAGKYSTQDLMIMILHNRFKLLI